jgi:hypothetical protein
LANAQPIDGLHTCGQVVRDVENTLR